MALTARTHLALVAALVVGCAFDSDECDINPDVCADQTETGDGDESTGDAAQEPCGQSGCECEAGTCFTGLVCALSEVCFECSEGMPGCPCRIDGSCDVGSCSYGLDADGTKWSICYPADLLSCTDRPCPGDAHCNDSHMCAWP